ncbi:hypothetical protein FACS189491_00850 [Spirochaetia bacterium]|nr:hypothetical protein FACS189491_00850 [Spirochaetia bacterium]
MPEQVKTSSPDNRKNIRYRTLARVHIHGILGGESLLKDLSVTGCCVECTSLADIQPNNRYKLEIIPEKAAKIGKFELEVEVKWVRPGADSGEAGLAITASPRGKLFQRYVDYLSWRAATGQSSPA